MIGLQLGGANLVDEAQSFGFNSQPPLDLPSSEVSAASIPSAASLNSDVPFLAYSAIGQGNVKESALTDALVAGAIADNGKIMAPHLLRASSARPDRSSTPTSPTCGRRPRVPQTATAGSSADARGRELRNRCGRVPGELDIAAKTGTAETGSTGCSANWMIAMGPADPGERHRLPLLP